MQSASDVMSLVDASDTAVRTACVLELLKDSRRVPRFADKAVERAIAMLDDALQGSALLRGGTTQGFSGNLNALCWATDGYIAERAAMSSPPNYDDVEESLKQIQQELKQIQQEMNLVRTKIKLESPHGAPDFSFESARRFFGALAKLLAQRATGSLTRPTRDCSLAGGL